MNKPNRVVVVSSILGGVAAIALAVMFFWPGDALQIKAPSSGTRKSAADGPSGAADAEYVVIGGVRRRATDVAARRDASDTVKISNPYDPARIPTIAVDANPNIESIVEALRSGEHPERLSPLASPTPFDPAAFAADPEQYLRIVEPGRVFQTAQSGPGVPVLRSVSQRIFQMVEGESVRLRVRAAPETPVSFFSIDGGQFQNQTTAITVRANDQGIGEVKFFASAGTIGNIDILAGSPTATGQVRFLLKVAAVPE